MINTIFKLTYNYHIPLILKKGFQYEIVVVQIEGTIVDEFRVRSQSPYDSRTIDKSVEFTTSFGKWVSFQIVSRLQGLLSVLWCFLRDIRLTHCHECVDLIPEKGGTILFPRINMSIASWRRSPQATGVT